MTNRMTFDQITGGRRSATMGTTPLRGGAYTVPVIAKTDFNVNANAGTTDILLAQGIDTTGWVSAVVVARVHSKVTITATGFAVVVTNCSLVPEEPDTLFASTTVIGTSASFSNATTLPALDVAAFSGAIGSMVRVLLRITQGTAGLNQFALSCDLIGRPA